MTYHVFEPRASGMNRALTKQLLWVIVLLLGGLQAERALLLARHACEQRRVHQREWSSGALRDDAVGLAFSLRQRPAAA